MEIQGSNGSKIKIKPNSSIILGRANGFPSNDLSISRRHISFHFNQTTHTLSFEVLGKNPFWVFNKHQDNVKVKSFKRFQRGELGIHDLFCVSSKNPVWFSIKEIDDVRESQRDEIEGTFDSELSQSLENEDFELGFVDISSIDPVKEFGFLVIGHEFDQYPKQMIRNIKDWDWFLDDSREDSEDDEDSKKKRNKGGRKKRKKTSKGNDDVDEEWIAESEGEEPTTSTRKVQRPKYHTRSKDNGETRKGRVTKKSFDGKSKRDEEEEELEDEEDEEDETLGGFIVDDNTTEEVENEMDEDEEEEFMDDEDELED